MNVDARSLEIDNKLEFGRRLHRQVAGLSAFEEQGKTGTRSLAPFGATPSSNFNVLDGSGTAFPCCPRQRYFDPR